MFWAKVSGAPIAECAGTCSNACRGKVEDRSSGDPMEALLERVS